MDFFMIVAFGWLFCGFLGIAVAQSKGRSGGEGFIFGLLLGPIGLLIVALLPTMEAGRNSASGNAQRRPCPHCAEMIQPAAKVCRYCQRDVEPLVQATAQPPVDPSAPLVRCSECEQATPAAGAAWFLGRHWCPYCYARALR